MMTYTCRTGQAGQAGSKRGFTLLEVLVTIVLLSAGAVFLLEAFAIGTFAGGDNENTLIAANLAQEKIEQFRNVSYGSVVAEAKAAVTSFTFFEREVTVSTPQTGLKLVTVKVYWTPKGGEQNITLVTYVSDT